MNDEDHDDHEGREDETTKRTKSTKDTKTAAIHLERFKDAQNNAHAGFEQALAEIRAGGKRSHWIWYVFPQLAGLGTSSMSRAYGIEGVGEAEAYLRDSLLRSRLLAIAEAVAEQLDRGLTLERIMGSSIDVAKLVSSMTLFRSVANRLHEMERLDEYASLVRAADRILDVAATGGHPLCQFTLGRLRPGQ